MWGLLGHSWEGVIERGVKRGLKNDGWESLKRERTIKRKWIVSTELGLILIFNGGRICLLGLSLTIWGDISALSSHRTPLLKKRRLFHSFIQSVIHSCMHALDKYCLCPHGARSCAGYSNAAGKDTIPAIRVSILEGQMGLATSSSSRSWEWSARPPRRGESLTEAEKRGQSVQNEGTHPGDCLVRRPWARKAW